MSLNEQQRQQADQIFNNDIYPHLIKDTKQENSPSAYILGGQPGAGKSMLTEFLRVNKLDNNSIVINGDDFRRFHPEASALYEQYGADASRYTGEFASYITEKAIARASEERYNLIIEGTFRTAEIPLQTLNRLQNKGYRTGVAIITIPAETSWASVNERYQEQLAAGLEARMTPRSHHDLVVDRLAKNAETVYRQGNVNEFLVFNREKMLFDSNIHSESPQPIINNELNRLSESVLSPENFQALESFKETLNEKDGLTLAQKEQFILQVRNVYLDEQKSHNRNVNSELEP